jgi:general stress protein YciG
MKKGLADSEDELADMSGGVTVREAGRRGGRATLENQGTDFFREIGRKGGQRTAKLYRELLKEFGKKGGRPRHPSLNKPEGEKNQ